MSELEPIRRGRGLTVRVVGVVVLVAVCAFSGISLYYRQQTERRLQLGIETLPARPKEAFDRFAPAMRFSNLLTLGASARARVAFHDTLMSYTLGGLNTDPLTRKTYYDAAEAINMLTAMERSGAGDLADSKRRILEAVQGSNERVLSGGSLEAWREMKRFFTDDMRVADGIDPQLLAPYRAWVDTLETVQTGPLADRDARNEASEDYRIALLRSLGLTPSGPDGPLLLPVPENLSPQALFEAEERFRTALMSINVHRPEFDNGEPSVPLRLLAAKLQYNIGVLRLQHRLDSGLSLRSLGSEYIVQSTLPRDRRIFPGNRLLYDDFMQEVYGYYSENLGRMINGRFDEAYEQFIDLPDTVDPSLRAGFAVLADYHNLWALSVDGKGGNPASVLQVATADTARAGRGKEIIDALQSPSRALLIVQVP